MEVGKQIRLLVALAAVTVAHVAPAPAAGPFTYYASRAAFEAAQPGLPVQVFQPLTSGGDPFAAEQHGKQ